MPEALSEVWLRGPVPLVPAALQPVAHALLQAREEVEAAMRSLPESLLWQRPASLASPGFHLQHMSGVLDRLFTYAAGSTLSEQQLALLQAEGDSGATTADAAKLLQSFVAAVDDAVNNLILTDVNTLTQERSVGRAKLPSTVAGLLFHAAEHTMRHVGQLITTIRILQDQPQ